MQQVLGVGGVFMRFSDRKAMAVWYRDHLGIDVQDAWMGGQFPLRHDKDKDTAAVIWGTFEADSTYFGRLEQQVMINFRVAELDAMLDQLRAAGCNVDEKTERSDYGAFGWVTDPEGNRIELWEPPDVAPATG